jgi:hypothetical protein
MSLENSKVEEMHRDRAFIEEFTARVATILRRVEHLVEFAQNHFPEGRVSETKDDILRAAVVFIHTTLEDSLRFIGSRFIPLTSNVEVLNKIGLVDSSGVLRPEKFSLGKTCRTPRQDSRSAYC